MSNLKSLAKDTAIYGLSSIVGRFLNYLLVPLYTAKFTSESGGYGIVTHIYAITAFVMVLLIYGMETGFFRFANKKDENPQRVYSTILMSVGSSSLLFLLLSFAFLPLISGALGYANHPEYVGIMAIVVAVDAFQSIPFAYLRYQKRPIRFATIKLLGISSNIFFNLFFLLACPWIHTHAPGLISWFYNPDYGVGYVFISNLISTSLQMILLTPLFKGFPYVFDRVLMKKIFIYSFPLLILGVVGILNQTIDKMLFPLLYPDKEQGNIQLGIYGACSKIAMIMAMLTQAFRYAYEPFVFGKNKDADNKKTYANAMKYFIIFALLAFLGVTFYLDLLKFILREPGYWVGLRVVPIVMAAEILMGVYFNLSFWYKLIDETRWGAYFSIIGCVIIVGLNVLFVPVYGYMACAWAGVVGYAVITILSYVLGQKKYPIEYNLRSISVYILLAGILYAISQLVVIDNLIIRLLFRTLLLSVFIAYIIKKDMPLNQIPIINRLIKKKA
ncbi:oligosaccharide flippase family protein [Bacteroides sp. 519]|uniref:oligosaccharide flippase family protein n=1 Tax=Bacteroides sp. 519 TaxID=2302937 RepID=UPI0013CFA6BD|nr:oligosaccharide flippase family protein [Bacteroides sp. 519]NDV58089.1 polysaccharide biosynthesis protein [Bacteroides sp. 519]